MAVSAERVVIGRGMRSEIIAWADGKVVKLYFADKSAAFVAGEAAATKRAAELGIPVPVVYGTVEVDGRHGIIMERLEGPAMDVMFRRRPLGAPRLVRQLAALQAAMHQVDVSGEAVSQQDQLRRKINSRASPLAPGLRAAALVELERMPSGVALCHGDLHPQNVVWTSSRGFVVIDWDSPAYGNALADVARTYLILMAGRFHVPRRLSPWIALISRAICRSYLDAYRSRAGSQAVEPGSLATWLWINAAARLAEGVAAEEQWLTGIVERGAAAPRAQV